MYSKLTNSVRNRATRIPGAQVIGNGIEEMKDAPGGGHIVTVTDPEGFPISLIYGQAPAQAQSMPEKIILNDEIDKPRARKFQRFSPGPAAVHKVKCCCSILQSPE